MQLGLELGDKFEIKLGRKQIRLLPFGSAAEEEGKAPTSSILKSPLEANLTMKYCERQTTSRMWLCPIKMRIWHCPMRCKQAGGKVRNYTEH